MTSPA